MQTPVTAESIASLYGLTPRKECQFAVCYLGQHTNPAAILVEWQYDEGDAVVQAVLINGRMIQAQHLPDSMLPLLESWGERIEADQRDEFEQMALSRAIDAVQAHQEDA